MNQQTLHNLREDIRIAAARLRSTERGQSVLVDLHQLLNGAISQLDGGGWEAVIALIGCYRAGFMGSVLEAIG